MKKDIQLPVVEDVAIAIVHEMIESGEPMWNVYLVNLREEKLEKVLVTSTGYGELDGLPRKTSTLRYLVEELPPQSFVRLEPIIEDVFGLNNEYWVSFYIGTTMYDKKYVFVPESISDQNTTMVPLLKMKGVMIK